MSLACTMALYALTTGCTAPHRPVVVHNDNGQIVTVAYDTKTGKGHSHPASLTVGQIAAVLKGIRVGTRDRTGLGQLLGSTPNREAFTPQQVAGLAPYLVEALREASPDDIATFYLVSRDPRWGTVVTSGGVFVRGQLLHVILSNFATSPSEAPFEGMALETDSQDDPLYPISRFRYRVMFEPSDIVVPNDRAGRGMSLRYLDESKMVVVDLSRLNRESAAQ